MACVSGCRTSRRNRARPAGVLARFVCPTPDALVLERRDEALGDGVVMTVAASAHRMLKIVSPYECGQVHAGELRTLIRVERS